MYKKIILIGIFIVYIDHRHHTHNAYMRALCVQFVRKIRTADNCSATDTIAGDYIKILTYTKEI